MSSPTYTVLNPKASAARAAKVVKPAPRPSDLHGKTIGIIERWGRESAPGQGSIGVVIGAIRDELIARYGVSDARFHWVRELSRPAPQSAVEDLIAHADIVIVGTAR
mgnify:CR=1 FL=1